jgi:hypothetical protein
MGEGMPASETTQPAPGTAGGVLDHDPAAWREDFKMWLAENCVRRLGYDDACGATALWRDFGDWAIQAGTVPSTRATFARLLEEAGFERRGEMALGLVLRSDLAAQRNFEAQPIHHEPTKLTKTSSVSSIAKHAPIFSPTSASTEDLPEMPEGVMLIEWRPKAAPVRLESSTVTDVPKFVEMTLRQLDARLRGGTWHAGNWPLPVLLQRLACCGCHVTLEDPGRARQ